jgi:uncharacterized protein (DUF58 family)
MAKGTHRELMTPEIVNSVSGLSLLSKVVVERFLSGMHRSSKLGEGMEFSQYRAYQSGDDPRLLDWKMLARSGRYYIRQSEQQSQVVVRFILDASASMDHREEGLSKLEFARAIVACLSLLAQKQGDSIGLYALAQGTFVEVHPQLDQKQHNRLLLELLRIDPKGSWPQAAQATKIIPGRGKRELLIFLTDMYEHGRELSEFVKGLKTKNNELVLLHLMGGREMDFDHRESLTFEDLETGAKLKVDAKKARAHYLEALESKMAQIKEEMGALGVYHHLFRMDRDLGHALQLFLRERARLN